jgi:hypothetical protein
MHSILSYRIILNLRSASYRGQYIGSDIVFSLPMEFARGGDHIDETNLGTARGNDV